jgi:hypothetical protein
MSCSGKGYGIAPQSNYYLYSQFNLSDKTNNINEKISQKYRGFYPSFTPSLTNLSATSSLVGIYTKVYVNGSNFLPNGTTFIKFGNYDNLPVTYYSSFNLSFVVPPISIAGNYSVSVVNLYNGNFSPQVNQINNGVLNFSNSITYTIL